MAVSFVDRFLLKVGLLPKSSAGMSTVSGLPIDFIVGDNRSIDELRDIPRYPPFMQGLPVYSPATLLGTQQELMCDIKAIIANEQLLSEHYYPAITRLASLVQLLPASQSHHHRGAGGMLRHSLEVGLWALQQTEGKLIRGVVTPQLRKVIEPRWRLTVFLAGICHDLGKVVTDISVTDHSNEMRWRPYNQSLYDWANSHSIKNYFLHWQENRGKKHTNVSSTLLSYIVCQDTLDWLSNGGTDPLIWLTESLNNNPGSTNQIHNFVVKADQLSVEHDLKSMGVAMAGYEIGVPVERYLTDIMRRLVQEGIWRINEPSARVWNIEGTTYLVWPMAGEEIARRCKDEDIPGLPKTGDGILDMMVEREIAFMRSSEEADPFYYISPDVVTEKIPNMRMKAVRLRDHALISTMPIAPVPGQIHSSKHPAKEAIQTAPVKMDTNQGELSFTPQSICSAPIEHVQIPLSTVPSTPDNSSCAVGQLVNDAVLVMSEPIKNEMPPIQESEAQSVAFSTLPAAPARLSRDEMEGAMGELLRVLLGEFESGKKSFFALAVKLSDESIYLKWPDAFAGYGFTPKQILTELSEHGWLIAASDVAKVGDAEFPTGVSKSIKLGAVVGHLFRSSNVDALTSTESISPQPISQPELDGQHTTEQKQSPANFEDVFPMPDTPSKKVAKSRASRKKAAGQKTVVLSAIHSSTELTPSIQLSKPFLRKIPIEPYQDE